MTNVNEYIHWDAPGEEEELCYFVWDSFNNQLAPKSSDRNANHLVWLDACFAGHLTPGLPELPAILDLQQQPG